MKYLAMVEIDTDSVEHARQVLSERVYFDEEYEDDDGVKFHYTIAVAENVVEKVS